MNSIICSDTTFSDSTFITIPLNAGDDITCTFENDMTKIDLTIEGTECIINGAIVINEDFDGTPDSFLRIQDKTNDGTEKGFNTSVRPFDSNNEAIGLLTSTHNLELTDIPIVNIIGTDYREFLLKVNQVAGDPTICLDKIEIYQTDNSEISVYPFNENAILIWENVDSGVMKSIKLIDDKGKGVDMKLYVPDSLFGGLQLVILYCEFSMVNGAPEVWSVGPIII